MTKVAIVYHSGFGHTEKLAEAVADGARQGGAEVSLLKAEDLSSPDEGPWDALAQADAIVFGAPTYMGSLSAPFKAFMDASSKVWFTSGWKDKLAAGFTNSASPSGDKLASLQQLTVFAAQHGMLWVPLGLKTGFNSTGQDYETAVNRLGFFLGVGTQSFADAPPETAPNGAELETGKKLGERVASAAARWA